MIRTCGVDEASGLMTEHYLGEFPMKKHVLDIKLANLPVEGEGYGEDRPNRGRFDNRAESLIEIHAVLLRETAENPAGFVAIKGAVGFEFVTEDPFAGDDVGVGWRADELPCVIGEKSTVLVGLGCEPVWILESSPNCLGNRRERGDDINMEVETWPWTDDLASLTARDHLADR
jgi:hypothetical protein